MWSPRMWSHPEETKKCGVHREESSVPQAQPWGQNPLFPARPRSRASYGSHGPHLAFSCLTSALPRPAPASWPHWAGSLTCHTLSIPPCLCPGRQPPCAHLVLPRVLVCGGPSESRFPPCDFLHASSGAPPHWTPLPQRAGRSRGAAVGTASCLPSYLRAGVPKGRVSEKRARLRRQRGCRMGCR